MILLDTHALLWLDQGHKRARVLARTADRLHVSPVTILEIQMLMDIGRLKGGPDVFNRLIADDRWLVDEPPALKWFQDAAAATFTRDPFDRLIFAHARVRGWRLATADEALLAQLEPRERVEL